MSIALMTGLLSGPATELGLGLETLAEGVETAGQLALLEQLGCALYQGFWFHRPLEPQAFAALLPRSIAGEDGAEVAPPHAR